MAKHIFNDETFCKLLSAPKDISDSATNEMQNIFDGQTWNDFFMDPQEPHLQYCVTITTLDYFEMWIGSSPLNALSIRFLPS